MSIRILSALTLVFFLLSCQKDPQKKENPLAGINNTKVLQYAVEGKVLYETNCANCHQTNGTGLGKLIPPLNPSDYMRDDIGRTARIIKYGQKGGIIVNGQPYHQSMPANPHLTPIEIAKIMSYIYNIWGNDEGVITSKQVEDYLKNQVDPEKTD